MRFLEFYYLKLLVLRYPASDKSRKLIYQNARNFKALHTISPFSIHR